jgi:Chaperone of endosialidase
MKTKNMTILHLRKSIGRSPLRLGFLLIGLALAWFALSPPAQAVTPPPDGGYPGFNTAEGDFALNSQTTGASNTAIGNRALFSLTTGGNNTATGANALFSLTTSSFGGNNTATGVNALYSNTTIAGVSGFNNTATGANALHDNTTGPNNTATGANALHQSNLGEGNTAIGANALQSNTDTDFNTACGFAALQNNTTGFSNIALGATAGQNLTTGSDNIDIGNAGVAGESSTIRIGTVGTHANTFIAGISGVTVAGGVGVIINSSGHLGTVVSSERFKDEIKPMDKASEAILALKPVTFRYKHDLDPEGIPQFGLVAEQVEKVNPALVARDTQGKVYTVRYEAVNAMLLNEFLKEHGKVEEQGRKLPEQEVTIAEQRKSFQASITKLEATVAHQRKEMEALTASLKEQAAQIQKVSGQLEVSKAAPQTVVNNQ